VRNILQPKSSRLLGFKKLEISGKRQEWWSSQLNNNGSMQFLSVCVFEWVDLTKVSVMKAAVAGGIPPTMAGSQFLALESEKRFRGQPCDFCFVVYVNTKLI
jgi:hypothetical protein